MTGNLQAYITDNHGTIRVGQCLCKSLDQSLCKSTVAHREKGKAHLFREEFDPAMAAFTLAVECDPTSGIAFYCRGLSREMMGDALGADDDYRRGRELGYGDSDPR